MSDEVGKENMPTPEQPKEGLPETPAKAEIKPIAGGAPWVVENPEGIEDSQLKRIVIGLEKTPEVLRTEKRLESAFLKIEELYVKGVDEAEPILGEINRKLEDLAKKKVEAEPQIERLERPKTPEQAVKTLYDYLFNLMERGERERKPWGETGGLWSEYDTIQRWVKDIPKWEDETKNLRWGEKHDYLSNRLAREYPDGVFLKEKMELFLETMKRLHNRKIEVLKAEGGLEDLGVGKVGEAPAPILKTPLANIRPVDWYTISHIHKLFPESTNPENKIDLESAWRQWQEIGRHPFEFDHKENKWKDKEIKIGSWESGYTLRHMFKSDRVMAEVRAAIAREVGKKAGNDTVGIRAERLAHSILAVGLTFDMWDRERWKQKGKNQARDSMYFDWKRPRLYRQGRPGGPEDTIGCYWGCEEHGKEWESEGMRLPLEPVAITRLGEKEAKRRLELLRRNLKRALFLYSRADPSEGTIIGDFWTSTTVDNEYGVTVRLYDILKKKSLKDIPWLEPGKFEEEVYEGYFTYSLRIAASLENNINKLEWKPDKDGLTSRDFWTGMTDLTLRLGHFCPWLIARFPSKETVKRFLPRVLPSDKEKRKKTEGRAYEQARMLEAEDKIMRLRRILVRGILWTGSYLAQPNPTSLLTRGSFSEDEVYGTSLLGIKIGGRPGILDAIKAVGYLDDKNVRILQEEIREFRFHSRGGRTPLR